MCDKSLLVRGRLSFADVSGLLLRRCRLSALQGLPLHVQEVHRTSFGLMHQVRGVRLLLQRDVQPPVSEGVLQRAESGPASHQQSLQEMQRNVQDLLRAPWLQLPGLLRRRLLFQRVLRALSQLVFAVQRRPRQHVHSLLGGKDAHTQQVLCQLQRLLQDLQERHLKLHVLQHRTVPAQRTLSRAVSAVLLRQRRRL